MRESDAREYCGSDKRENLAREKRNAIAREKRALTKLCPKVDSCNNNV